MAGEESWVRLEDNKILAANRWFRFTCEKCGHAFYRNKMGHHGTQVENKLRKLFPEAARKRVQLALPANERPLFKETMNGKRAAKDGEIERWLSIQSALPKD
jgi:hypothetical protein